jgi:hypothetical protein
VKHKFDENRLLEDSSIKTKATENKLSIELGLVPAEASSPILAKGSPGIIQSERKVYKKLDW